MQQAKCAGETRQTPTSREDFSDRVTSIQEMTLTFVPKIIVIFLSLIVFMPFIIETLQTFMLGVADRIAGLS